MPGTVAACRCGGGGGTYRLDGLTVAQDEPGAHLESKLAVHQASLGLSAQQAQRELGVTVPQPPPMGLAHLLA